MPRRKKEVVAKRGCTCCGTGCAIIGVVVPTATFAVETAIGVTGATMLWLIVLGFAHGVRHRRRVVAVFERAPVNDEKSPAGSR